jgi:predicted GNAT superfamily acetyltransferase
MRDSTVMAAVLVNPSKIAGEWLEPGEPVLDAGPERRLLVEIPTGFSDMQLRRPELALAWRLTTRKIFQTYFARGFRAVDFFLAGDAGRGHYLLAT